MAHAVQFALIGCGNIGTAILKGALSRGILRAAETLVVDAHEERRKMAGALGTHTSASASDAAGAQCIALAVKPQVFESVALDLRTEHNERLVISVMAGWSAAGIARELGAPDAHRVLRAMPNIASQIGLGMTAIAAPPGMPAAELEFAERLFSGIGQTVRVREDQIDAATAVSGSGPAYFFLLAEAKVRAARELGFDEQTSRALVAHTLLGAATLLATGRASAEELRASVTSRGGTTEAALRVFEERGFTEIVARAMEAARDRGRELGR